MSKSDSAIRDLGYLDTLAGRSSCIHRLDPRAKLLVTVAFIVTVVSFDKYQVSSLLPFFVFPILMIAAANLPAGYLLRRMLWILPFIVFIGIFNPLLDRAVLVRLGSVEIAGGWISFVSILMRSFLTVLAALILVATTGFYVICMALEKMGVPNVFVMQLMFLYRYAFVLGEEISSMVRAWQLRAPLHRVMSLKTFSTLLGTLFLRTSSRAHRIYQAMLCRQFDGRIQTAGQLKWRMADTLFVAGMGIFLIIVRLANPAQILGQFITGIFS